MQIGVDGNLQRHKTEDAPKQTMSTTTIPTVIAKAIAERAREDLEYAAEKHADCVTKAHELRQRGNKEESAEAAAVYYSEAEKMDAKAERHDTEFKNLERICIALTKAGV